MSKAEAVSELIRRGYDARLENGVVMIYAPISNDKISQFEKLLKSIGYDMSWGLKNSEGSNG